MQSMLKFLSLPVHPPVESWTSFLVASHDPGHGEQKLGSTMPNSAKKLPVQTWLKIEQNLIMFSAPLFTRIKRQICEKQSHTLENTFSSMFNTSSLMYVP